MAPNNTGESCVRISDLGHDRVDAGPDLPISERARDAGFEISPTELEELMAGRNLKDLNSIGGADALAKRVNSGPSGIEIREGDESSEKTKLRREIYGDNNVEKMPDKSFLRFLIEASKDNLLLIIICVAILQLVIGTYSLIVDNSASRLFEGSSVILVVILVILITSINDYQKHKLFRNIGKYSEEIKLSKVMRNNEVKMVHTTDLLVGDVLYIEPGMVLPADCIVMESFQLKLNETSLTGESNDTNKSSGEDPFLFSGTNVTEGRGKALVTAVGAHTMSGKIMKSLKVPPIKTPLQEKLSRMSSTISKVGFSLSLLFFVIMLSIYCSKTQNRSPSKIVGDILGIVVECVTLIVVIIPEGLPLAVTLTLAYAGSCMLRDSNFVRTLGSCEVMGSVTYICTDKTGTLTMNQMSVTNAIVSDTHVNISKELVPEIEKYEAASLVATCINIATSAEKTRDKDGKESISGSRTEAALVQFTDAMGYNYEESRRTFKIISTQPFSSKRKYSGVTFEPGKFKDSNLLNKSGDFYIVSVLGAAETVLSECTHYLSNNKLLKFDSESKKRFEDYIGEYANNALRTLAIAVKTSNGVPEKYLSDLTICAIAGISDPLRPEITQAINHCKSAGITVIMVTGDNIDTARAIAKNCGIYVNNQDVVIEGKDFRILPQENLAKILPNLKVLARSTPIDKQILVKSLQNRGEVVAVTGDGSNDAPALKMSNVGFSMGITGTDIAKEASDIVILDDNFYSIVRAISWGRTIVDSVKKFIQFQLSVNISATVITITTALFSSITTGKSEPVFKPNQLLWVNLIMDTIASLALSTDKPSKDCLNRKPIKVSESIMTPEMRTMTFAQAIYQITVCLVLYFAAPAIYESLGINLSENMIRTRLSSLEFNTFVFCQFFNELNCRTATTNTNIFVGIFKNRFFIPLVTITIIIQIVVMQAGYRVFGVVKGGLNIYEWLLCIGIASLTLVVGFLTRLISAQIYGHKTPTSTLSSPHPGPIQEDTEIEIEPKHTQIHESGHQDHKHLVRVGMDIKNLSKWRSVRRVITAINIYKLMKSGRMRNEEMLYNSLGRRFNDTKSSDGTVEDSDIH